MCLFLKKDKDTIKQAKKDIPCYKVLSRHKSDDGTHQLRTPFMQDEVDYGITVKAEGENRTTIDFAEWEEGRFKFSRKLMGEGFIHTFKSIKDAEISLENAFYDFYNPVIIKCFIPKGTWYYEGEFEYTGSVSYASESLRYGKRIVKDYSKGIK